MRIVGKLITIVWRADVEGLEIIEKSALNYLTELTKDDKLYEVL